MYEIFGDCDSVRNMEIGSVLELDNWSCYCYKEHNQELELPFMELSDRQYKTYFYQNARNAIEELAFYLYHTRGIEDFLIPQYICETVSAAFKRAGVKVHEYKINRQFEINISQIEQKIQNRTCIFIPHYFGIPITDELRDKIVDWKSRGIVIIEDITMSLLSKEKNKVGYGDYIVGSIRKWLPIPDGGFVCVADGQAYEERKKADSGAYANLYTIVQMMKREYVFGGEKDKSLKDNYRNYYKDAIDILFSDYTIREMSKLSYNYILNCKYEDIIRRRILNYDYLYNNIKNHKVRCLAKREKEYCPFMMVIVSENRDELLKYLIQQDIYCNIHWNLEEATGETEKYLSQHMLSIPCDQRYTVQDMERIVQAVNAY